MIVKWHIFFFIQKWKFRNYVFRKFPQISVLMCHLNNMISWPLSFFPAYFKYWIIRVRWFYSRTTEISQYCIILKLNRSLLTLFLMSTIDLFCSQINKINFTIKICVRESPRLKLFHVGNLQIYIVEEDFQLNFFKNINFHTSLGKFYRLMSSHV